MAEKRRRRKWEERDQRFTPSGVDGAAPVAASVSSMQIGPRVWLASRGDRLASTKATVSTSEFDYGSNSLSLILTASRAAHAPRLASSTYVLLCRQQQNVAAKGEQLRNSRNSLDFFRQSSSERAQGVYRMFMAEMYG